MAEKNEVKVKITAENKSAEAFKEAQEGMEKVGISADTLKEQLGGLATALTIGGLIEFAKQGIETASVMADLAEKTGVSVDRLSAYKLAAAQSGTDLNMVGESLQKLARNMAQAAIGTGTAATSFKAIGVAITDSNGHLRDADTVLREIADRFATYQDGAAKAALAQQIFGRSGAELIPFLDQGAAGLNKAADQAKLFGVALTQDVADKMREIGDTIDGLKVAFASIGTTMAVQMYPTLKVIAEAADGAGASFKSFGEYMGSGFSTVLQSVAALAVNVAYVFKQMGNEIGGLAAQAAALAHGDFRAVAAIHTMMIADAKKARAEVDALTARIVAPPSASADPGEAKPTRTAAPVAAAIGADKAAAAARLAALKADIAAQLALLKDANTRALADLDQQLKDHQVSVQQYYADRVKLQQQAIDAEIAAQRKALAESPAQAERIKIENEIILLERQRGDVAVKAARDQEAAEQKLNDQISQVRAALLRAQGQTGEATKAQLQAQYKDLLESLQAQGDAAGVSLVRKLIDVSGAQADLQQVEADYQRALTAMQTAEQGVQAQVTTGLLTQAQGQQKIAELHKETAAQVTALIPKMEALAAATGNPDAILRVQRIKQQIEQLGEVVDANAVRLKGALQNDLAQFFENIATGSRNAGDAFRSFAQSVVADIAKMASEALAASAIKQLFAAAGGSGWGAAISAAASAAGYASGGIVHGPGSGTSDSIPARLSAGEFVVNAAAVKRVGSGMLHAINSLGHGPGVPHGPRLGFAEGGFVPAAGEPSQPSGPSVRIVNVVDPALAGDWVNSPAGEKAIINILQRNAGAVKQVLA